MSTRVVVRGTRALSVYDDRWRPLLEALGALNVKRASEVEFDHVTGDWVAVEVASGRVIARGRSRADVIAAEVAYLERGL
jgi:hypothetical protein